MTSIYLSTLPELKGCARDKSSKSPEWAPFSLPFEISRFEFARENLAPLC